MKKKICKDIKKVKRQEQKIMETRLNELTLDFDWKLGPFSKLKI